MLAALSGTRLPPQRTEDVPLKGSLLDALSFDETSTFGGGAITQILSDADELKIFDNARITDVARQFNDNNFHESLRPDALCRSLRYLSDWSQTEFFIRIQHDLILVRSDIVRALIKPTKVVLMSSSANSVFQDFVRELRQHLRQCAGGTRAFGQAVLEAVVCANVTMQTLRFKVLSPVARDVLDGFKLDADESKIMKLYPIKRAMSEFIENLRPLANGLDAVVLERLSTPQMRSNSLEGVPPVAELSHFESATSFHSDVIGGRRNAENHFGDVLEQYRSSAAEVFLDAEELVSSVNDAMTFVEQSMKVAENKLIELDYSAEGPNMALMWGSFISAVFGMNLSGGGAPTPDSWWLTPDSFYWAVAATVASSLLLVFIVFYAVRGTKQYYNKHGTTFGNNKFFGNVGSDDYIVGLMRNAGTANAVDWVERRPMIEKIPDIVKHDLSTPILPVSRSNTLQRRSMARTASTSVPSCLLSPSHASPLNTASPRATSSLRQ